MGQCQGYYEPQQWDLIEDCQAQYNGTDEAVMLEVLFDLFTIADTRGTGYLDDEAMIQVVIRFAACGSIERGADLVGTAMEQCLLSFEPQSPGFVTFCELLELLLQEESSLGILFKNKETIIARAANDPKYSPTPIARLRANSSPIHQASPGESLEGADGESTETDFSLRPCSVGERPGWTQEGERWFYEQEPQGSATGCWGPPQSLPDIRSVGYLKDKVKQTSLAPAFQLITSKVFKSKLKPKAPYAESIPSLKEFLSQADPDRFFFFAIWALPGPPFYTVVHMLERTLPEGEDPAFDNVWARYLEGNAAYRDTRLKFIPNLIDAPKLVMGAIKTLGGTRPVIIGKRLKQEHFSGANYVEVSTDVGSSWVATKVKDIVIKEFANICVEYSWVLEGKKVDELPERVLGGACIARAVIKEVAQALKT